MHWQIKWSFYRNKLFTAPLTNGGGHQQIHIHNNIPIEGTAFDLVERGRARQLGSKLVIDVVSTGKKDFLSTQAISAIIKHFKLDENTIDLEVLIGSGCCPKSQRLSTDK